MKHFKTVIILLMLMVTTSSAYAASSYDISELYSVKKAPSGTKAVGSSDKTMDVKYILTPTKVDTGKYIVKNRRQPLPD